MCRDNLGISVILLLAGQSGMWIILQTSRYFSLLHSHIFLHADFYCLSNKTERQKNRNVTSFLSDVLQERNMYIHTMPEYPHTSPKYKPLLLNEQMARSSFYLW
jgi:hypothetical protein